LHMGRAVLYALGSKLPMRSMLGSLQASG
jgi:hypothetical protein